MEKSLEELFPRDKDLELKLIDLASLPNYIFLYIKIKTDLFIKRIN